MDCWGVAVMAVTEFNGQAGEGFNSASKFRQTLNAGMS
jgi:hypothetical protein